MKFLLTTPAAALVDYEKLLWIPKTQIVVPDFPLSIHGIPYHIYTDDMGTWLGIDRIILVHPPFQGILRSLDENELRRKT